MTRVFFRLVLLAFLTQGMPAHAHHPNEGSLSLDDLIQEALANNLSIKESQANFEATVSRKKAALGAFSPEISLEGGPLTTKFDDQKQSGTAAYGKAEWNLYRGGRDSAERSKRDIESAFAQKQFNQTRARISREVARVYYEMAFILESITIQEKALEINQEQMKLARTKKLAGFTSEADVIEFELREATIRSDIREILLDKEKKSRELSVLLGRAESTVDLAVKGHLEQNDKRAPNKEKLIQALLDSNPELTETKANLEISKTEKTVVRSTFFPKLDLQAKYGKIATDEKVFSDSNNYSVGIVLNIPLFSGFSSLNEVRAASSLVARNEAQMTRQALSAKAEAESLYSKLSTIRERLELEEKTLSRSEQYYKITLGEYRRGVKNSPDMVGAAERLLNSRIRNLEFRRDYELTLLGILSLVGAAPNDKGLIY